MAQSPANALPTFAAIYERYFDFIWTSVRRLRVSGEAVDDVVQEVFVVIHSRLHTLQQPESLRSWIYGVVRRTVSSHHRSRRAQESSAHDVVYFDQARESSLPTPFEQTDRNDQLQMLAKLLDDLDDSKREVFVLAELEELTAPEIAAALEIPLNTVYSRLRAARQAFELALTRRRSASSRGLGHA